MIFSKKDKTVYNAEKQNKKINYEYLNTHYCKVGQTVLAGDSITEIFNHTELFDNYRKESGLDVYNRGISGDTSNKLLERFEKNVLNIKPKNLVILIGTNDFAYGLSRDDTVNNIDSILDMTRKALPNTNVILQSVYPVNTVMRKFDKKKNAQIPALNKRIEKIAQKHKVTFLDLTDILSDDNGDLKKDYTYDGLHPNVFAFEAVTKKLLPLLK